MKILLTSAYDTHVQLDALLQLATSDRRGEHRLVDSPEHADAIVFVEGAQFDDYFYARLRQHPWVKQYPKKVFMYNEVDYPWCTLPGLYCSMPSTDFQHDRQIAFPYISNLNPHVPHIHTWDTPRRWLFSFVGSASHRLRRDVLALGDACAEASIHDTSEFDAWHCQDKRQAAECQLYADTMAESLYVLCPRGLGTSSSRLFEAMEAGRVPVIISDNWVAPPHIDWRFAVRVAEADIARIPQQLAAIRDEGLARGQAARDAWEQAYSPSTLFHTTASSIELLRNSRSHTSALAASVDRLYRTRVQVEHSVRTFARALKNAQNGLRAG